MIFGILWFHLLPGYLSSRTWQSYNRTSSIRRRLFFFSSHSVVEALSNMSSREGARRYIFTCLHIGSPSSILHRASVNTRRTSTLLSLSLALLEFTLTLKLPANGFKGHSCKVPKWHIRRVCNVISITRPYYAYAPWHINWCRFTSHPAALNNIMFLRVPGNILITICGIRLEFFYKMIT